MNYTKSFPQNLYSFQTTMKSGIRFFLPILFAIVSLISCSKESVTPELTVSVTSLFVTAEKDTAEMTVSSNDKWTIANSASAWLQLSQIAGASGTATIQIIAQTNSTGVSRSTILIVNSPSGQSRRVTVSQPSLIYPSYNTSPKSPDATGMSSTAVELAAKIKLGWNLGNTFEAPGGETGWGSPVITEDYIKFVKQNGFNAIRIPCAWNWYHVDNKATEHIDSNWLNRVKEVVGYCVNNDMYVLLNIHWDGGWLDSNINKIKQDSVNAKQKALWEQIATTMRDFDEHLMFASANEPSVNNAQDLEILMSYHQSFINAVRSTGGRNTYRTLVIQGSSDYVTVSGFPKDPTADRMMYEEHNYTPFQFTLLDGDASWGKMFYYWGTGHHSTIEPDRNATWGEEDVQMQYFQKIKGQFIDKGIPVIMGEYGAYRRDGSKNVPLDLATHNDAVDYWLTYVTKQSIAHGLKPFFWDTGGALDRSNYTVKDQRTIDAINAGAK